MYSAPGLNLLKDAGKKTDTLFIELEAMELLTEMAPENETYLNNLAKRYEELKDGRNYLKVRQKLSALHPDDLELQGALREAAAIATMEEGGWDTDEEKSFTEKIKKTDENKVDSKMGDKIIRAEDDIRHNIKLYEDEIERGNESLDMYRKLADLYMKIGDYQKCIDTYQFIVKKVGTLDPAIDKAIEKAHCAILQKQADDILAAKGPDAEEKVKKIKDEIYAYRLGRYEERIKLYPQDLQLRYEIAELYWEGHEIEKAMEQFQLAQRNPQKRLLAIVYLGRCFHEKGQDDMAIEQFEKAISEMPVMDKVKMDTLYHMGITYESIGNMEKAMDCFKQIYSADIAFRDVSQRIDKFYQSKKKAAAN